jgi:hypothetical protein
VLKSKKNFEEINKREEDRSFTLIFVNVKFFVGTNNLSQMNQSQQKIDACQGFIISEKVLFCSNFCQKNQSYRFALLRMFNLATKTLILLRF